MVDVGVGKALLIRSSLPVAGMDEYVFVRSGSQHVSEARLSLHYGGPALNMFLTSGSQYISAIGSQHISEVVAIHISKVRPSIHF